MLVLTLYCRHVPTRSAPSGHSGWFVTTQSAGDNTAHGCHSTDTDCPKLQAGEANTKLLVSPTFLFNHLC